VDEYDSEAAELIRQCRELRLRAEELAAATRELAESHRAALQALHQTEKHIRATRDLPT
jgi:hypothetical protein